MRIVRGVLILLALCEAGASAQDAPKEVWQQRYRTETADAIAAELESPSRAVYRYRVAVAGLLRLQPGMVAADIGAGSGFLARVMAEQVGPSGTVIATELNPALVDYMKARSRAEKLSNFQALLGMPADSGLDAGSVDAVAVVNTFSYFDQPREMLRSIARALKAGGLLLIVDFAREAQGASASGIDADEVVALAKEAGFERLDESGIVPGEYALRFKKPPAVKP